MRIIKPQRLSIQQRVFEIRRERYLAIGVSAYVPFEAPDLPLPEISMWQELPRQMGANVALDEALPKPRGELLVHGKAFAPGGAPQPAFRARVTLGPSDKAVIDKTIYVVGKRRWVRGAPSEPEPLTELALGWDKAFGGPKFPHNPMGMGIAPVIEGDAKVHYLPHLEDPKHLLTSPSDTPRPAGFGPIDPSWPERVSRAGTYDAKWLDEDFPGFARDLDPAYFMTAAADQRLPDFFQGGEPIRLENLHPSEPAQVTRVTELAARCFITRRTADGEPLEELATRLETVVLLPNVARMVAIFRAVARVAEDDGADVTCLVAALERKGAPRPKEHYQAVLEARLDKKKGHLVALRDRDLLPELDPSAPKLPDETFSDMEELLRREGVMERRSRERAGRELEELRRSARVFGVDPDAQGLPRELPPPEEPPSLDELDVYMERVEGEAARLEAEAKRRQDEALAEARRQLAEQGVDLDEAIARSAREGGGPPKFRADEHLARMRETAQVGRDLGAPMEELEAQIEDPAFIAKLRSLEETQLMMYRATAHHLPPALAPGADEAHAVRARVEAALATGTPMSGWDLTGADLRGLDLSRAALREALLEGADLREAKLEGADLTGAVLTRARLDGARLEGANLEGANLGEARAAGINLERTRLGKAVLQRADLEGARLAEADLRGADLFEARLPGADLTRALADEALFYGCSLDGARLDRASLRKATLFRCSLTGASLAEATLEGACLVETHAVGASLREAHADGLRLIAGSTLTEADLSGAELARATMRGVGLGKATLAGVRAEGCDLSESDLTEARLDGANLKGARFIRADLTGADLAEANLMEAMLQNAKMPGASFRRANLFRANLMGAVGDERTSFEGAHVVRALFLRRAL